MNAYLRSIIPLFIIACIAFVLVAGGVWRLNQNQKQEALDREELMRATLRTELLKTVSHNRQAQDDVPETDVSLIRQTLDKQIEAWNSGDIDGFMTTYWKSDSLTFSSGGSTTRGWQATLDRYKNKYNSREKMGTLRFGELEIQTLSDHVALVLGTWHLTLKPENMEGNFSLVMKKFDGIWLIVHDHSSLKKAE
ncbi:MAG: nuclear transport factor 2 family protein [Pirellulales bacterium]